jgi:molecular chaperone Hsp33
MDSLTKALAFDETVRVVAVVTTDCVQHAIRVHDTGPTASAALGRLLTAALLLGATKKGAERLTLQIDGDGPIGSFLATTEEEGEVYAAIQHPHAERPLRADGTLDVSGVVGSGFITGIRQLGVGEPYLSAVPLATGEIGDDVAAFLADSEQIRSAVGVGVRLSPEGRCLGAGGFLVQVLGGVSALELDQIEDRLRSLTSLSRIIEEGATPKTIVEAIAGADFRILDDIPTRYRCPRDRDYFAGRLVGMDSAALNDAFAGTGLLEVICDYCRTSYEFTPEDLAQPN